MNLKFEFGTCRDQFCCAFRISIRRLAGEIRAEWADAIVQTAARQIAAIEESMRAVLGFDKDVNGRLIQARFLAGCAQSFAQAAGLFADLFNKRLTQEECRELIDFVEEIARIDGPSTVQTAEIETLKGRVGLAPR